MKQFLLLNRFRIIKKHLYFLVWYGFLIRLSKTYLRMRIEETVRLAIRPVRTLIALGIKPSVSLKTSLDPRVVLMMCTASNRSGIKFNLSSNIRRIDDRFLNRGKCTIELINPVKTIFMAF